jgi:hypothetical protein
MESLKNRKSFLPPIKPSEDKLALHKKSPLLLESNLNKNKEYYEARVDKFSILTKQPEKTERIKIQSLARRSTDASNQPVSTPINFKWDPKEMPKIKLSKANDILSSQVEKSKDKKKRLMFEQKIAIDHKLFDKAVRKMRSMEYLAHTNEISKQIKERDVLLNREFKPNRELSDIWCSIDSKDIKLQKEIVNMFYSLDNRRIRHKRLAQPDFFTFTENKCLDNQEKNLLQQNV